MAMHTRDPARVVHVRENLLVELRVFQIHGSVSFVFRLIWASLDFDLLVELGNVEQPKRLRD
jgi:hypothetical protein